MMLATKMMFLGTNMPADLAKRVQELAEENERTVGAEIRRALLAHLECEHARREGK